MLKLVVLCAFFAAAAGNPGVIVTSPITPLTTVVSPAETTIFKQASSVVHPSPILYNAPWGYPHFIKKRSPQVAISYIAPSSYLTTGPIATTYTSPLIHSAPLLPTATLPVTTAHWIKKRSAPLLTSFAAAPLVASTYTATAPLIPTTSYSTPYLTASPLISQPITYSTHFIKKRSAPLLTPYISPAAISTQSRIDLHGAPWINSYNAPITYSAQIPAITRFI